MSEQLKENTRNCSNLRCIAT